MRPAALRVQKAGYGEGETGGWQGADHPAHDDDEFLTIVKVPVSEVLEMAQDGRLADGKSLSTLLLARHELEIRRLL